MIFWDTSALLPLLAPEPRSAAARELVEEDSDLAVWWGTGVECRSALARWRRLRSAPRQLVEQAEFLLTALEEHWFEVAPSDEVRETAGLLLRRHDLRAADALRLGAAHRWAGGRPRGLRFATLDERLGEAAYAEGFTVVPSSS